MNITLQGNLGHFRLRDILEFLARSERTGTLRLVGSDRETSALIDHGAVIFAASDHEDLGMAFVLARKQVINKEQRRQLETLLQGVNFSETAIKEGVFDTDTLRGMSEAHVLEVIVDAMLWEGGSFYFSPDIDLPSSAVPVGLTFDAIMEASQKRVEEWEECRNLFPDPTVAFQVVGDPESDDKITLSVLQFKTLLRIKEMGSSSVGQLCRILDREPLEVYRTLHALKQSGLIIEAKGESVPASAPVIPAEAPLTTPPPPPPEAPEPTIPAEGEPEATVATPLAGLKASKPADRQAEEPPLGIITLDDAARTSYPLYESEYTIGREPTNKIQIPDGSVSGSHARIVRTPTGYLLEDISSRNGTYVNGERIQSRVLQNEDKLRLGKVHMIFNLPSEALHDKTTSRGS